MIIENLVPEIYYKESRDFAYAGRLLEIVSNYMKTDADAVKVNPANKNADSLLVDLACNTLGFFGNHKYAINDLVYLINCFTYLLKNKGTAEAIRTAVQMLISSQGLTLSNDPMEKMEFLEIDTSDPQTIEIRLPEKLKDVVLLEDIFDYILPAGMLYRFVKIGSKSNSGNDVLISSETYDTMLYNEALFNTAPEDQKGKQIRVSKYPASKNELGIGTLYTGTIKTDDMIKPASSKKKSTKRKSSKYDK